MSELRGTNQFERTGAMLASDFDGTQFLTSERGPGIATVSDAYAEGIDALFGSQTAQDFVEEGGHNHRTPAEIIQDLHPDTSAQEIESFAQELTALKLEILVDQVGKKLPDGALWPRPTDGFLEVWQFIESHNNSPEQDRIFTSVISAGHVPFIRAVFDKHGLWQPDTIVTDDTLVEEFSMGHLTSAERAKPATPLLEVATLLWLGKLGVNDAGNMKQSIVYCGDSQEKDGGLAHNFNVPFVLIDQLTCEKDGWPCVRDMLSTMLLGNTALDEVIS